MQGCARFEHTTFRRKHIAVDPALDDHGLCSDLAANVRVLADDERAGGVDFSLHVAVDQQLVAESQIAVDRYAAGKHAARTRAPRGNARTFGCGYWKFPRSCRFA